MRKQLRQRQRQLGSLGLVTAQQRLPHQACAGTREHNQPRAQLGQAVPSQSRALRVRALRPGTRQQFAQIQIALLVLHQQQQTALLPCPLPRRLAWAAIDHDIGPQQGFDALATGCLVKLDGRKQIVQIRDGQCALPVLRSRSHRIAHAQGAVNNRILRVQTQVNKIAHFKSNSKVLTTRSFFCIAPSPPYSLS